MNISEPFTEPRQQGQIHPPQPVLAPRGHDRRAPGHPEAIHREPSAEPWAHRSQGPATLAVIALWLRRSLADSARAWALAAGVPPDLYTEPPAEQAPQRPPSQDANRGGSRI